MVNFTLAPAMGVTQECVRRRFRHASCRACVDACPARVFSDTAAGITVDAERCMECGDCLFVCPTEAITGITPPKRFLCGDTLVGPFTGRAPTLNELLLWHAQRGVRFISLEAEQSPGWMMALAGLNLVLRRRNEPLWSFKAGLKKEVNTARRTLLHVPQEDVTACAVLPGQRQQRKAYGNISESEIVLDTGNCVLCGACWRSCCENAIRFEEARLTVEPARCTGCGGCEAVCQHHALKVMSKDALAKITTHQAYGASCISCHRTFWSFNPDEKQCSLCLHHAHGMRNPDCC